MNFLVPNVQRNMVDAFSDFWWKRPCILGELVKTWISKARLHGLSKKAVVQGHSLRPTFGHSPLSATAASRKCTALSVRQNASRSHHVMFISALPQTRSDTTVLIRSTGSPHASALEPLLHKKTTNRLRARCLCLVKGGEGTEERLVRANLRHQLLSKFGYLLYYELPIQIKVVLVSSKIRSRLTTVGPV